MNAFVPILVIVTLGIMSGAVFSGRAWPFWAKAMVAALAATLIWGCGAYLILWLVSTGPEKDEAGYWTPRLVPILETFVTTLIPAALMIRMISMHKQKPRA